jgi:hypothetical protein
MKLIITRAYISAVFAVVLPFFSLSAFADCFEDGFNAGLAACPTTSNCDAKYNEGVDAGKSACQSDPASCGIPSDDGINCQNAAQSCSIPSDDGINCQNAAPNCGLYTYNDVTPAGLTKGKQECTQNIVQCVSDTGAIESALVQIAPICKDNPYLCFGASEPPALSDGVVFCKGEDKNCLMQVEPGKPHFKLHLPVVYYLQDNESVPLFEDVEMNWVPDSPFVFVVTKGKLSVSDDTRQKKLKLSVSQNEGGQVISLPIGIRCLSNNGEDCTEKYVKDSTVELFAVPSSGFSFHEWDCKGKKSTDNPHSLKMDTDKTCTATFAKN